VRLRKSARQGIKHRRFFLGKNSQGWRLQAVLRKIQIICGSVTSLSLFL
jgi:hypothetical protein